jgi:Tol biopolymer transport system component
MKRLLLCLFALCVAGPAAAEDGAGRALAIADLYRIKSVADPRFSPDGKRIAFHATEYDLEKGTSDSDIFIMNADGTGLRRMTQGPNADYRARWSRDGKSLLFLSTRENGAQAWRLPVDGGEAVQLTDFSMGVDESVWTHDGKRIVFTSEVFAECGADSECNKKLAKDMDDGAVQAHLADDLLYRHWTFWKDGKRFHTIVYDVDADTYTDLTPGEVDAPYYMTGGANAGWAVSPDGGELCVSSNFDPNHWETTNKDLFLVPTTGGDLVNVTDENEAYDGNPEYSPDGRTIAYLMQRVPRYEGDLMRLAVYDRGSGEKTVLTDDFDYWVHSFQWAPDSKSIYFTAQ